MSSSSTSIDSSEQSSSSSSIEIWNMGKPLVLSNSAIDGGTTNNRLAQTIKLTSDSYYIGKVYCYLMGIYGESNEFTVNFGIYLCNEDGEPNSLVQLSTLSGDQINGDDWYPFVFNINVESPLNQFLSFVMWQEGGDENNYIMWAYGMESTLDSLDKAFISNDASTWIQDDGIKRSIRIIGDYNPFNLIDGQFETNPAKTKEIQLIFNERNPSYYLTEFNENDSMVVKYPPIGLSFIVDNSGSMGWNDRFENRREIINEITSEIMSKYPNEFLFDFVTFGAKFANASSVNSNLGEPMTINLDANNPSRRTYVFNFNDLVNVEKGTEYQHNGFTYTINYNGYGVNTVNCTGNGTPLRSGILTRVDGYGPDSIIFSSYNSMNFSDGMIAFGFMNMEEGHQYIIGGIKVDDLSISSTSIENYSLYYPSDEIPYFEGSNNGPNNNFAINVFSTENSVLRKRLTNRFINLTNMTSNAIAGSDKVDVNDTSSFFVNNIIDLIDGHNISASHTIVSIDSDNKQLQFSPTLQFDINNNNSTVEENASIYETRFDGTTIRLLIKDELVTRPITFFLHNSNGWSMEWDFTPHNDWIFNNLYYLDQTAILPISIFDDNEEPFEDGTMIVLEVDEKKDLKDLLKTSKIPTPIAKIANVGDTEIEVESLDGYIVGMKIDIIGDVKSGNIRKRAVQTVTIIEMGTDGDKFYIKFLEPLIYEFDPNFHGRIVTNEQNRKDVTEDMSVAVYLPIVDVTPVETGTSLDPLLLASYDPTPVNPPVNPGDEEEKNEIYDSLNYYREIIRRGTIDSPTISGYVHTRVLPITEDVLTPYAKKDIFSESLLRGEPRSIYAAQTERQDGDFDSFEIPSFKEEATEEKGVDYIIETPVFLKVGNASSRMTTTSTELKQEKYNGYNIPGIPSPLELLTKTYTIYPHIKEESPTGVVTGIQYFDEFKINFVNPIKIYSSLDNFGTVDFYCEKTATSEEGCKSYLGYKKQKMYGVHAGETPGRIDYIVANKGILVKNGILNIKLYSNTIMDQEGFTCANIDVVNENLSREYMNVKPLSQQGVDTLSQIDQWRDFVEKNPFSKLISGESSYGGWQDEMKDKVLNLINNSQLGKYYKSLGAGATSDDEESPLYDFYSDPSSWTLANQYEFNNFSIPIVNGRATLDIPSSDTVATIFVEASYGVNGTRYESIRADLVMVRNPLMIGELTPYKTSPDGDLNKRYELGGIVTWNDGNNGTIDNNTFVNYILSVSEANPSVSSTENGWAGGVFLGPKERIIYPPSVTGEDSSCPPEPVVETVKLTITHSSGWSTKLSRNIYWFGEREESPDNYFKFHVTGSSTGWSDGLDVARVKSDINSSINRSEDWVGDNGVDALLGYLQPNGDSRPVYHSYVEISPDSILWGTYNGVVEFSHSGQNISIGNSPKDPDTQKIKPWGVEAWFGTYYKYPGEMTKVGRGIETLSISGKASPPVFKFKEPLSIEIEYENEYLRDGETSTTIVASAYWKGDIITEDFIINQENQISIKFPRPFIYFLAGETDYEIKDGKKEYKFNFVPQEGAPPEYKDFRGRFECSLDVNYNKDVKLSSYKVQTNLSRTDRYTSELDNRRHTHACVVDDNGDGITTSTITLPNLNIVGEDSSSESSEDMVPDHIHNIVNYNAQESSYGGLQEAHVHGLRSVAITHLLPTKNKILHISVIGIVEYDPTYALPYPIKGAGVGERYPLYGNRMMFDSVSFNPLGEAGLSKLVMDLRGGLQEISDPSKASTYYASEHANDTLSGFNITAKAYFTAYTFENEQGDLEVVPERNVDDGSRIVTSIRVFSPASPIDGSQLKPNYAIVSGPDVVRNYMILSIRASISAEGQYASEEIQIAIDSNLNWLPDYRALSFDPTNDLIYISEATSYVRTAGGSAVYDAIRLAAKRIIAHQEIYPEFSSYKKAIILLTDGDENSSQYSLDQAIKSVGFIDGGGIPVIPVNLGDVYNADQIILTKIYIDTKGFQVSSFDVESADIPSLVDFIFTNPSWIVGRGTYRNTASLGLPSIPDKLFLNDVVAEVGSAVEFRYRTSIDGSRWGLWSQWLNYTESHLVDEILDSKTLYFEYELKLIGNSDFNTPFVNQDMTIRYFEPSDFAIFFKPLTIGGGNINEGNHKSGYSENGVRDSDKTPLYGIEEAKRFLSSIHITHEADIPPTSTVQYGITQSDSDDIDAFYSAINPDEQTILLTRYNEPMVTGNNKVYKALNGSWPDKVEISLYRINNQYPNGILVNKNEYASNNIEGIVTFYNGQSKEDKFVICIEVYPSFRLVCKVDNYGSKRAIIHHIGIVYNMMKRIPTDKNGTIIHTPINSRIK
jgi:hypothetical protein